MSSFEPEDFERVERFRQWIAEQCEARGINPTSVKGSEELADNYNRSKKATKPELESKAFRMWHQRQEKTGNVRRSSCYQWALALDIPVNTVLKQAGYLTDDLYAELMELPVADQVKYATFSGEERGEVSALIAEIYCRRPA